MAGQRLVVLVEDRAGPPCEAAHGLSLWLESGGAVLLVDTGPDPGVLTRNAARLGLDLGRVEAVLLSHGHYDHTGGLPAVVAARGGRPLRVFMHPSAVRERFSLRTGSPRSIGMPVASREALAAPGVSVTLAPGPTTVGPGVWVTGTIPRRHPGNEDAFLVLDPDGRTPDRFEDDQAVVVEGTGGLTVICGCAHSGVVNILDHVARLRPGVPLARLVGGLHLGGSPAGAVGKVVDEVADRGLRQCAVGHCTGERAEEVFSARFPGAVRLVCGAELSSP